METEAHTFHAGSPHSRTLTPTAAVRPRPRLPLSLSTRSRSIEHPTTGNELAPTMDGHGGGGVDDLAGALSELGRTDFVRKYSRKSRASRPSAVNAAATAHAHSPTSAADIDIRSADTSPVVSAASRYQHLRSPVMMTSTGGRDSTATTHCRDEEGIVDQCLPVATPTTDNQINIPAQQRLTDDQSRPERRSAMVKTAMVEHPNDGKTTVCDDGKRQRSAGSSTRAPRAAAAAGLFRSESDSSKVRSFALRSLQQKASTTMPAAGAAVDVPVPTPLCPKVAGVPPPVPRVRATVPPVSDSLPLPSLTLANSMGLPDRSSGGVDTDDEGVGAVDIDEPCFKDTYMSVTAANASGGTASSRTGLEFTSLQQYRNTQIPPGYAGDGRGHHQRSAEHGVSATEMSASVPGTTGGAASTPKSSNGGGAGRFQTHPPLRERSVTHEPGSVDSNGLGALRDVTDPAKYCLVSQMSLSSADSHICPSEDSTSLSHLAAADDHPPSAAAVATNSDGAPLVRRNSKTQQKHKSRSDPTKNGDSSLVDIPSIVSGTLHAQSSPVLLDEQPRCDQSTMHFTFNNDSASASDVSDRGGATVDVLTSTSRSDDHTISATAGDSSAKSSPAESMQDVAVQVVLKSDDSFEDVSATSVKPPRPKATKKRPRAPAAPLTTSITTSEASSSASSLVRKMFHKDHRNSSDRLTAAKDAGDSHSDLVASASTSSLTLPLSKKASLLRSHSSAGDEAGGAGDAGSVAPSRSKHAELSQSLIVTRQRSPGAPDSTDVVPPRNGVVTASASVPELCDATRGNRLLHAKEHHISVTTSYTPSLEPVLSSSTVSLFDGAAGDKVGTTTLYDNAPPQQKLCFVHKRPKDCFRVGRFEQ